ncbi:desumoylating isopeptidase 1 [Trichonephila clavipes]|nr:desumoylating isopeptidase 1 [Trichonephila clavipes]
MSTINNAYELYNAYLKTLSTALKEYFNKLSLRAEGSKGISFGPSERVPEEHRNGHAPETATPRPAQNGTRRKKSSAGMSSGNSAQPKQQATPKEQPTVVPEQPQQIAQEPPQQNAVPESTPAQQQPSQEANEAPPSEPNQQVVSNGTELSNGAPRRGSVEESEEGQTTFAPRRARRYDDPPVIFPDVDGAALLKQIVELVEGKLTPEENKDLSEFMEYLTTDGGAWALGASHLETIGRLLNDRNLRPEVPVLALRMFQAAALKEDIILLLHQDREKHHLMTYFYKIESLAPDEQTEVCALMCNMCANGSSFDWLTYISEWEEDGKPCNNSKVTVRVAVHGLLADHPETRMRGCALVYNLALKKELFDDIASELAMAVLQFLQTPPAEEMLFQSLTALYRFMCISYNEIPALMKMMGPDVDAFRGVSARIEPVVEEIQMKLRVAR